VDKPTFQEMSAHIGGLMHSKLGLVKEKVELDVRDFGTAPIVIKEQKDDEMFRDEVRKILTTEVLGPNGRVLILLDLATQHALATTPIFLQNKVDCYFTYFPPESKQIPPDQSYYQPFVTQRVMEVALAHDIRIEDAKRGFERENLRGIMINIHSHAGKEDKEGVFESFYPSEETLKRLDIKSVVLLSETHPDNSQAVYDFITQNNNESVGLRSYIRKLVQAGFPLKVKGIDRREREKAVEFQTHKELSSTKIFKEFHGDLVEYNGKREIKYPLIEIKKDNPKLKSLKF
jgi:hypothetical protein